MDIFDRLFSKKKKDSTTPKVEVEPNMHDYQKTVVSVESRESLLKHADTGRPVVISGGDFSSKTVIIVSKPSKYPNHIFDGKSYPVVTVDRLTIGTYEQVTFIGDIPQEEIDRLYEIEKQRRDAAEKKRMNLIRTNSRLSMNHTETCVLQLPRPSGQMLRSLNQSP